MRVAVVTGVQTCALPIYRRRPVRAAGRTGRCPRAGSLRGYTGRFCLLLEPAGGDRGSLSIEAWDNRFTSEEGRVGQGGRGWRGHARSSEDTVTVASERRQ